MTELTLSKATAAGDRLACLKVLADRLAAEIDACDTPAVLPHLSRQYREALREIAELEPKGDDDIDDIIGDLPRVR